MDMGSQKRLTQKTEGKFRMFRWNRLNALLVALVFTATGAQAVESLTATVTEVVSPDRLRVDAQGVVRDIRLYGVDCPEEGQPHHTEALAYVKEKALNKEVTVEILTQDSLGIDVARVILPGYVNLNHSLLSKGLGWWDEPNTPEDGVLKRYSATALVEEIGLWADAAPLAPWDYRKSHDGEEYTYSLAKEEAAAPEESADDETPMLSASGKGRYVEKENHFSAQNLNIDPASLDINNLLVKHQPRMATDANGNTLGLTANAIHEIPGAAQLGFQEGDIISGLNGESITNIAQVYGLVEKNRNAKQFQVNVVRGGRPITLTITP